jgi:hypothetical protein
VNIPHGGIAFTEIILMLSGGSMSTSADPVQSAVMLAEQVLPQLRGDSC